MKSFGDLIISGIALGIVMTAAQYFVKSFKETHSSNKSNANKNVSLKNVPVYLWIILVVLIMAIFF